MGGARAEIYSRYRDSQKSENQKEKNTHTNCDILIYFMGLIRSYVILIVHMQNKMQTYYNLFN